MWTRTLKRKLKVLDIAANKASGVEHVSNNVSDRHMLAGALNSLGVCCVCFVSCCFAATRLHCQHGMHITLIIAWLPIAMPWNSTCCRCKLSHLPLRMRVGVHGGCLSLLVSFGPSWNTDRGVWCMCKLVCVWPWAQWQWQLGNVHQQPTDHLREVWVRVHALGPERWWTMPEKNEFRGNFDGGSQRYWRANRSSYLGIGAKD